MRLQLTVTHRAPATSPAVGPSSVDVEVDAPTGSSAGELVDALAAHLSPGGAPGPSDTRSQPPHEALQLLVAGEVVPAHSLIGSAPLLDGASISLRTARPLQVNGARTTPSRRTTVALAVTHGPDCGRTVDLLPGRTTLGRSDEADVCLQDSSLSRLHAAVTVDGDGVTLCDLGSTNGTSVDGAPLGSEPLPITTASTIHLGDSAVAIRHPGSVPAAITATGEGTLAVNRRPRVAVPTPPVTITLPTAPATPRRARVPWVAALLPLPVAGVLALVVGPTMLAFALMGPVIMLGTAVSDRWGSRRTYAAERASHDEEHRAATERIAAACRDEVDALRQGSPDAATVLEIATGPSERLWERRRSDPDSFRVTVGRCRRDASVGVLQGPGEHVRPQLESAPCTLSLAEVGVLGLCGDVGRVSAVARLLVGQLVTLHSPTDLTIVPLLRDDVAASRWGWLRRVPHSTNGIGEDRRTVSAVLDRGDSTALATIAALATTVRERCSDHRGGSWEGPTTVVVVDGASAFRGVPDLAALLTQGPRVGVLCIALDGERGALPLEAGAVLELPRGQAATLVAPGHHHADLVVDGVEPPWAERISRALAPLRDAAPSDGPRALPTSVGLLACRSPVDVWDDVDEDVRGTGARLVEAWRRRPHSTSVPLGISRGGPFEVDLATDGPHVLVAGTTGSGKSELLRTLVASLALHNTPQHLSFVLVDYKGGAAFRDCAALPHVAGVVTDLDDQLAARALTSLMAEVTRRETLFRDAGVADFPSYQRIPEGISSPLARLVVVVDEFRALAEELPTFVDGLVRLASLGRSLGIHLVLATQRPAGVVTADIKANVNLRIALRVRDVVDSEDVVDSPAAARVDPATPGRAHLRAGGEALVEIQAAHVGAALPPRSSPSVRVRTVTDGLPTSWPSSTAGTERSELEVIVDVVRRATDLAALQPAPAAWLPPLPASLPHGCLDEPAVPFTVHLGLVDLPERQRQQPLALDLHGRGHWAVAGSPGSGRSTMLLTVARTACARLGPDQLHVYAVSGGSLASLASLPQVGACIDWSDLARVERLVTRLSGAVADRRAALAGRGHPDLQSWWGGEDAADAPPPMLVLVDDWDLVSSRNDDLELATLVDRLVALLREGEAVGLTAVLAGDRSLLMGRVGNVISQRVVLRLSDPSDAVLLGMAPRQVAALRSPGQGLTAHGHRMQLALPPRAMAEHPTSQWSVPRDNPVHDRQPLRVDAPPTRVRLDDLAHHDLGPRAVALGIGGDDSAVVGLAPDKDGRRWLVSGAAGSGVSSTLLLVATTLVAAGGPVAVVSLRPGPLDALEEGHGLAAWCDGTDLRPLVDARRRTPSLAVIVDDADELQDHPVEAVLREISQRVDRDGGLLVVGAASSALSAMYRGLAIEVARHRTGLVLAPGSTPEARVLGAPLPVARDAQPGRGHLVRRGSVTPLQVALIEDPPPRSLVPGRRGSVTT